MDSSENLAFVAWAVSQYTFGSARESVKSLRNVLALITKCLKRTMLGLPVDFVKHSGCSHSKVPAPRKTPAAMSLVTTKDGMTVIYVDYFSRTCQSVNIKTGAQKLLHTFRFPPKSIAHSPAGAPGRLFVCTVGSRDKKYCDGQLLVSIDGGKKFAVLYSELHYPNAVYVSGSTGDVLVGEARGCSTTYGGRTCISRFSRSQGWKKRVELANVSQPHGLVQLPSGHVLVGEMGGSSPGTGGRVRMYDAGFKKSHIVVKNIAANKALRTDTQGNLHFIYCYTQGNFHFISFICYYKT